MDRVQTGRCKGQTRYYLSPLITSFADKLNFRKMDATKLSSGTTETTVRINRVWGFALLLVGSAALGQDTASVGASEAGGGATVGPSGVSPSTTKSDIAPSAIDYYVNSSDASCSDRHTGRSRTFVSRSNGPWCTIGRSNSVAHPGAETPGHVTVYIEAGSYRNQLLDPANSGISSTQRLRWCAMGGNVTLLGPASGRVTFAWRIDTNFIQIGGCDSNKIIVDGEVVFGTGSGQVEKGEAPEPYSHIQKGGEIYGDDWWLEIDQKRTAGWNAIYIDETSTRGILRSNFSQHGTPYYPDGNDFGDVLWVDRDASTMFYLFDGGKDGRDWIRPGHSINLTGGVILTRGIRLDSRWGSIPTFAKDDGNRTIAISRQITNSHMHDVIVNGSGRPQDQPFSPCITFEGTRTALSNSVVRNCYGPALHSWSASWSKHARGLRVAHVVFDGLGGPVMDGGDFDSEPGDSPFSDMQFKNIIVRDWTTNDDCCNAAGNWDDVLFNIALRGSQTLGNTLQIHGMTVETANGSCADPLIVVYGGASPGTRTLQRAMSEFPGSFTNISCVKDVNLDNVSAGDDVTFASLVSDYALVDDSISRGRGVALTTATNTGTGSTNLCVADVTWFPDPKPGGSVDWGAPGVGQWSGAYQAHVIGKGNVTYTDATITTAPAGCLTLSSGATWASGVAVNYSISSGDKPNRGVVR